MAASITDKYRKSRTLTATTVGTGGIAISATTLPLTDGSAFPTETAVTVIVDRVDSAGNFQPTKVEEITGIVSGNSLINCIRGQQGTTNGPHTAGATVELSYTGGMHNDEVDSYLTQHAQDGTHKAVTATSLSTDTISEKTSAAGVTIDSLKVKDGGPTGWDGWMIADETWTYASSDTAAGGSTSTNGVSTYTLTITGDKTAKYSAGMRVKLTQTSTKYFFITAVSYSNPSTTMTLFGGTDYTLANATITNPFYSTMKCPQGFPLDPIKWTVRMDDTSTQTQTSPSQNTIYNVGSLSCTAPIGSFNVGYKVVCIISKATATTCNARFGLATANNATPAGEFNGGAVISGASGTIGVAVPFAVEKTVTNAAKQQYFLNAVTFTSGGLASVVFDGSFATTTIWATCAYL